MFQTHELHPYLFSSSLTEDTRPVTFILGEFKAKWAKQTNKQSETWSPEIRIHWYGGPSGHGPRICFKFLWEIWGKNLCPRCYSWFLPLSLGSNKAGICLFLSFPHIPCLPGQSLTYSHLTVCFDVILPDLFCSFVSCPSKSIFVFFPSNLFPHSAIKIRWSELNTHLQIWSYQWRIKDASSP